MSKSGNLRNGDYIGKHDKKVKDMKLRKLIAQYFRFQFAVHI